MRAASQVAGAALPPFGRSGRPLAIGEANPEAERPAPGGQDIDHWRGRATNLARRQQCDGQAWPGPPRDVVAEHGDTDAAGLDAAQWTPRELRHSFVSLLSDKGVPLEQIARLVGHTGGSTVTETVYRKQLRPVINDGAVAMNELFPRGDRYSTRYSPEPATSKRPGLER
jgi:hypothetical protein